MCRDSTHRNQGENVVDWQNAWTFQLAKQNYQTAQDNVALAERIIERKNTTKFFEGLRGALNSAKQVQLYQAQQNLLQSMRQVILDKTNLETITNNAQWTMKNTLLL